MASEATILNLINTTIQDNTTRDITEAELRAVFTAILQSHTNPEEAGDILAQADAEAGTATAGKLITAAVLKAAIDALAKDAVLADGIDLAAALDAGVITKLEASGNWTGADYTGTAITGTYKYQLHTNISLGYMYIARADNDWIRIPLSSGGGSVALNDLTDVVITSPSNGQVLKFDGTNWVNGADATGSGSTVTIYANMTAANAASPADGTIAIVSALATGVPGLIFREAGAWKVQSVLVFGSNYIRELSEGGEGIDFRSTGSGNYSVDIRKAIEVITANTTISSFQAQISKIYRCEPTGAGLTITLPAISTSVSGRPVRIVNNSATENVTVNVGSGATFPTTGKLNATSSTSHTLTPGQWIEVASPTSGTVYWILDKGTY